MPSAPDKGVRFRQTRWPAGYSMGEVDHFVTVVEDALAFGVPPISSTDIATRRFTPVQLKPGYDMDEVDQYLEEARRSLRDREDRLSQSLRSTTAVTDAESSGHCPGCRCFEPGPSGTREAGTT
jgi:DivIVA domain-containing protein